MSLFAGCNADVRGRSFPSTSITREIRLRPDLGASKIRGLVSIRVSVIPVLVAAIGISCKSSFPVPSATRRGRAHTLRLAARKALPRGERSDRRSTCRPSSDPLASSMCKIARARRRSARRSPQGVAEVSEERVLIALARESTYAERGCRSTGPLSASLGRAPELSAPLAESGRSPSAFTESVVRAVRALRCARSWRYTHCLSRWRSRRG